MNHFAIGACLLLGIAGVVACAPDLRGRTCETDDDCFSGETCSEQGSCTPLTSDPTPDGQDQTNGSDVENDSTQPVRAASLGEACQTDEACALGHCCESDWTCCAQWSSVESLAGLTEWGAAVGYDPARELFVILDGTETYLLSGETRQVSTCCPTPGGAEVPLGGAMTYAVDYSDGGLLFFGGDDTWFLPSDASQWQNTGIDPPERGVSRPRMAACGTSGPIVVFGARLDVEFHFEQGSWNESDISVPEDHRIGATVAWNARTDQLVLAGGQGDDFRSVSTDAVSSRSCDQSWLSDSVGLPESYVWSAMVGVRGGLFIFGGSRQRVSDVMDDGVGTNDAYLRISDGVWSDIASLVSGGEPSPRYDHAMASDGEGTVVLLPGRGVTEENVWVLW